MVSTEISFLFNSILFAPGARLLTWALTWSLNVAENNTNWQLVGKALLDEA